MPQKRLLNTGLLLLAKNSLLKNKLEAKKSPKQAQSTVFSRLRQCLGAEPRDYREDTPTDQQPKRVKNKDSFLNVRVMSLIFEHYRRTILNEPC